MLNFSQEVAITHGQGNMTISFTGPSGNVTCISNILLDISPWMTNKGLNTTHLKSNSWHFHSKSPIVSFTSIRGKTFTLFLTSFSLSHPISNLLPNSVWSTLKMYTKSNQFLPSLLLLWSKLTVLTGNSAITLFLTFFLSPSLLTIFCRPEASWHPLLKTLCAFTTYSK